MFTTGEANPLRANYQITWTSGAFMASKIPANSVPVLPGQSEKTGFVLPKFLWLSSRTSRRYQVAPVKHTYTLVAKGSDKRVVRATHLGDRNVAYAPVRKLGGLYSKESVLKKEFQKIRTIRDGVKDYTHLALDITELQAQQRIDNKYSLTTPAARCDLEDELRKPELSFTKRINYCTQYLNGLKNLHAANVAHGDIKPENCLIFNDDNGDVVKIADFGKAQKIPPNGHKTYKGNLRFCPPEGVLTTKGDVFSSALLIVRMLEETSGVLDEDGVLVPVLNRDRDSNNVQGKGRGIDKYVVDHGRFLGIDSQNLKGNITRRLPRQVKISRQSSFNKNKQETLIKDYIDVLFKKLEQKKALNKTSAEQLKSLLKDMIKVNPNDRITAEEAHERMTKIEQQLALPKSRREKN